MGGGVNTYTYVIADPLNKIDPFGLNTLVIDNGPTSGNPFGHSAIAVSGSGVYSYGNNPNDPNGNYSGANLTEYLSGQALRRDTNVFDIPTTPEQEKLILDYLKSHTDKLPGFPYFPDNCAGRVENALAAGGVSLSDPFTFGSSPLPFPAPLERSLANLSNQGGANWTFIPQNGTVPSNLSVFNPTAK